MDSIGCNYNQRGLVTPIIKTPGVHYLFFDSRELEIGDPLCVRWGEFGAMFATTTAARYIPQCKWTLTSLWLFLLCCI